MKKNILAVSVLATMLFAGVASAQTTNQLQVTSQSAGAVTPGTGVVVGTVTLSSPAGSYTVSNIPTTLSTTGGGSASNLTNCAVYSQGGTSVGPTSVTTSGQNSFSVNPPVTVTAGSPVTYNIRCDVATSTPTGTAFLFSTAATSTVGSTVSGASLSAMADFVKTLPSGLNNAIVGVITLDATHSNQAISVKSVPISVSASNGATLSTISSCVLTTPNGVVLTTGGNAVSSVTGDNTFTLDSPLNIPGGQGALLVLRCNVAANAPVGGLLTVGFSPSAFQAMAANGNAVTVTQGSTVSGTPGTSSGVITIGAAGSQQVGTPTTPSTPLVPNTGMGGDAVTLWSIILLSGAIAIFGAYVAMRRL